MGTSGVYPRHPADPHRTGPSASLAERGNASQAAVWRARPDAMSRITPRTSSTTESGTRGDIPPVAVLVDPPDACSPVAFTGALEAPAALEAFESGSAEA